MKPLIYTLVLFVSAALTLNGQRCSDLFISEIVFSGDGSSYAVEIFNPTSNAISLSSYKIGLLPEQGTGTLVSLSGSVPAEGVTVISNRTVNSEISAVSDIQDDALTFQNKSVLQLVKGVNNTVIDRIGNQGLGTNVSQIDLAQLLNDPDYLDNLSIDLSSVKNLVVRRSRKVQSGKPVFDNQDILSNWRILPNLETSNLGEHINACLVPILSWKNWSQFEPEEKRWEWDPTEVYGTIESTEELPDDATIFLANVGHLFINPPAFGASESSGDFTSPVDPSLDLTIPAGETEGEFLLMVVNDDIIQEGDEGTGFLFDIDQNDQSGAMQDDLAYLFDVLIIEDDLNGTSSVNLSKEIEIAPTIVDDFTKLSISDPSLKIEQVAVVNMELKYHQVFVFPDVSEATIDLSALTAKGYYLVLVKTSKGIAVKRIVKG